MKIKKRNLLIISLYFFSFFVSPFTIRAELNPDSPTVFESIIESVGDLEGDADSEEALSQELNKTDDQESVNRENKAEDENSDLETEPADPVASMGKESKNDFESSGELEVEHVQDEKIQSFSTFTAVFATTRESYPDAVQLKYEIQITNSGYSIDTLPWGVAGHKNAGKGSSHNYIGQTVQVISESPNGAYAEIENDGTYLGWIDKKAFNGNVVRTKNAYLVNNGYSIDTLPWGTIGFSKIGNTSQHLGKNVKIVMSDVSNNYYLAVIDGSVAGWIDNKAFSNPENHQSAMIFKGGYSVDSLPWGTPGFERVGSSTDYLGSKVTLVVSSENNAYALALLNDKQLGWIDKKALSTSQTNDKKYLINPGYSIDTKPWGEPGNQKLGATGNHLNKAVYVNNISDNLAYYFVKEANGETLGWIDSKAFSNPAEHQPAMVIRNGFSIDTRPWGEPGFKKKANSADFYGESVTKIAQSLNKAYVLVETSNGVLGWVDKKALVINPTKQKNFILYPQYSIDNKPWGEEGYQSRGIGKTDAYLNQEVYIYAVSDNNAYYFVKSASGNPLGWIDNKALGNINGLKRTIKKSGYSIDSRPWGEQGFENLGKSDNHINKTVNVLGTSSNGAYSAILINGKFAGWLDNKAFQVLIYLDPGHGGIPSKGGNPGAVYNGVREQDLNLTISLQVRDELVALGYQVVMSREDGNNSYANRWQDDLYARPAHANEIGADILVSVHHNASGIWDSSMNGIETYVYIPKSSNPPLPENEDSHDNPLKMSESRKLANAIHKDLISNTGANNRGVKDGAFVVVREAEMPAVLLELGFMSNRAELNKLTTNSYQQKLVNGIVSGIHNYFLI